MTIFDTHDRFARLYPETAGLLRHNLAGHPLFALEGLLALAGRMRPVDVEYNRGNLPIGVDPASAIGNGLSIAETIRGIADNGSWMVLKFVEQDEIYRALLHDILDELRPVTAPRTGAMIKREGFIFVSSPHAVTPFHFDPEHNILLQLRGTKTMAVFPADDDTIVSGADHERFHAGGHRNLPWRDDLAARGTPFALTPGDGIHVPVKAPHWVRNGPAVSISFSITWRSEWSYREGDARGMNAVMRAAGLNPAAPGRYPAQNLVKSVGYRAIRKLTSRLFR
jgi:hypothetical protein